MNNKKHSKNADTSTSLTMTLKCQVCLCACTYVHRHTHFGSQRQRDLMSVNPFVRAFKFWLKIRQLIVPKVLIIYISFREKITVRFLNKMAKPDRYISNSKHDKNCQIAPMCALLSSFMIFAPSLIIFNLQYQLYMTFFL